MNGPLTNPTATLKGLLERLSPRQRQFAMLGAILAGGVGLLWLVFAFTDEGSKGTAAKTSAGTSGPVNNLGVMPPGQQVNAVDQWVGTAGSKLAQYENERDEQGRLNKDRQAFEARTMQRFAELELRLTAASQAGLNGNAQGQGQLAPPAGLQPSITQASPLPQPQSAAAVRQPPSASTLAPPSANSPWPQAAGLPMPPGSLATSRLPSPLILPTGQQMLQPAVNTLPLLTRVTVTERSAPSATPGAPTADNPATSDTRTVSTFLPVSFTRGTLLGGLDAPTGGQSQSNPHPVLIRLSDNSVLPNQFRGEYRDCFVIAAGYGDISSERAYLRTENLSCVRADGAALEVKIQGSVYGEDGKVGMRGRLVTKQGQMLANALLAGVVSGIGQGLSTSSTNVSTSPLGTITSAAGADAYRAGLGSGVGRALDRLAQYYIKLAENTFPVIEVDAGREIDVVITKGVRIDVPMAGHASRAARVLADPVDRFLEGNDDGSY